MQEERIPLQSDIDTDIDIEIESDSDLEKSGEFDYKNLIARQSEELGCIICFKTNEEIPEKYGCVQCSQCQLCKDCALDIILRKTNRRLKNKCPVCSKTKGWCKNLTTNEILLKKKRELSDIENQRMVIIERAVFRRIRPDYDDLRVICYILGCMAMAFLCYMFYINKDNMLNRKRENLM